MARKATEFKVVHIQVPISEEEREERIRILAKQLVAMDMNARLKQIEITNEFK